MEKTLNAMTEQLTPLFRQGFLRREVTVFQFLFDTGDPFYLIVEPTAFRFETGIASRPTLTITLDQHETLLPLLTGTEDSMTAFMRGRFRANGHIVLTQLLLYLFRPTDPVSVFEVSD